MEKIVTVPQVMEKIVTVKEEKFELKEIERIIEKVVIDTRI
mgnify:CR=1 FL=1